MTKDCLGYEIKGEPHCKRCVEKRWHELIGQGLIELHETASGLRCRTCGLSLSESRGDD